MRIGRYVLAAASVLTGAVTLSLVAGSALAQRSQWYFYITNRSNSTLTAVYVAEQDKPWGRFDVGSGIKPGQTVKMVWNKSTDSEDCYQWIKGVYADGSESTPAKIDFCQDLDNPIEF